MDHAVSESMELIFRELLFEANEDENKFDSNQEYEILSRKTDGYIYFIRKILISIQLEMHNSFTGRMGRNKNPNTCLASMLDGKPRRIF